MSHEKTGLGSVNTVNPGSVLSDMGVEESYQKALGAHVIRFSFLSFLLEDFSRKVFAISEPTATIVLNDLPLTRLIGKLRACATHRMLRKSDRKEFLSILNRAERTAEQRNELMHALWIISEGQPVICYRRRKKVQSPSTSIGGINELTRSIDLLSGDLFEFIKRQPLVTPAGEAVVNAFTGLKKKHP